MLSERRWNELIGRLSEGRPPEGVFWSIVDVYSQPHRRYHNLSHIAHCLAELDAAVGLAKRPDEVEFAVWLHDAVHDPRRTDNEEKSASWALDILAQSGCAGRTREKIRELILATKHSGRPASPDAELIVDVDLSILGQPPEIYNAYEESIRGEYSWVPVPAYAAGRSRILRSFLGRPRLYFTGHFETSYGMRARKNISRALVALASSAEQGG
jgi:predicted metal-dependent HD superfamily phosphohydrolase